MLDGDSSYGYSVARTIAAASLEPEDARVLGVLLAKGDTGISAPSRTQFLGQPVPATVWAAYAEVVRTGGIGTYATLVEGASKSPKVAAAAMGYVAGMERGEARQKLVEMLVAAEFSAGIEPHLDYGRVRAGFKESRDFDWHQDVVRLINRHDPGAVSWYIELARDPDHPLRHRAMYEIGGVRHNRAAAVRFCLEEAWLDPTLGMWSRTWPLVRMWSWPEAADIEFVPFWDQVLDEMAAGDETIAREGITRFTSPSPPPGTPAVIAVGRRLERDTDPRVLDLAVNMAKAGGHEASLDGFIQMLERSANSGSAIYTRYRLKVHEVAERIKNRDAEIPPN